MDKETREPGDASPEEDFAALLDRETHTMRSFEPGDRIEAKILQIGADSIFLDVGAKGEGVLERRELTDAEGCLTVHEGETVKVWFLGAETGELRFTTKVGGEASGKEVLAAAYRAGIPVEGRVVREIKGGFEVRIGGTAKGFCPHSQISLRRIDDTGQYLDQDLLFRIVEYADSGRNLVLSRRSLLEEEARKRRQELRARLRAGDTVEGTVTRVKEFGAFVDIGGLEALLPASEIGWMRVENPADVLAPQEQVKVLVKSIDWEQDRVTVSLKDSLPDPWETAEEKFPPGSRHQGLVARLQPFGAFVTLEAGVDGLLHISRLGEGKRVHHPREVLEEGMTIEVEVESCDREKRRISLVPAAAGRTEAAERQAVAEYQGRQSQEGSFGSLGDLLKAQMEKKPK